MALEIKIKNQFYKLLFLIVLLSSHVLAANAVLCKSFYLSPVSIEFGKLYQDAKDLATLEALNEQSKNLVFALENPDPLDHLINTLLFYRGLTRFLSVEKLESQFERKDYRFLYRSIKAEAGKSNEKFNYFRRYLLGGVTPIHYSESMPR